MRKILLLPLAAISLMIISGFISKPKADNKQNTVTSKNSLRVMTYNVRHCNPPSKKGVIEVESIARVINEANPDLVALQEIDRFTKRSGLELDQAKELGKLTGMHSYFVKAIDWDGGEYGIAILSKFKILDSVNIQLPMVS